MDNMFDEYLLPLEQKRFYNNLVTIEFTEHFIDRLKERLDFNSMSDFVENAEIIAEKLSEKVFLSTTKEFRVYCKLIKAYVIIKFNALKKHIEFITVFPIAGNRLDIKYTNIQQLLISI